MGLRLTVGDHLVLNRTGTFGFCEQSWQFSIHHLEVGFKGAFYQSVKPSWILDVAAMNLFDRSATTDDPFRDPHDRLVHAPIWLNPGVDIDDDLVVRELRTKQSASPGNCASEGRPYISDRAHSSHSVEGDSHNVVAVLRKASTTESS